MLKKIFKKAKFANASVFKINDLHANACEQQKILEAVQKQLAQLQHSVATLAEQQIWLKNHFLQNHINLYLDDPNPGFEPVASQLCTYDQMLHPDYVQWCNEIEKSTFLRNLFPNVKKLSNVRHRKVWEFCYILQALKARNLIKDFSTGLGFGVGTEPLPALLAKYGCKVTATDMDADDAAKMGWAGNEDLVQHSQQLNDLNKDGICDPEVFRKNCTFRIVDMNHIPDDLQGFDFTWSACCLEHLGSIKAGNDFIKNSLKCLNENGVAVHTTEFNLSSDVATVDNHHTVLYRRQDILRLAEELEAEGHTVSPITFNAGAYVADGFVDVPPYYAHNFHLKLLLGEYVTTSIGLIINKGRS